MKENKKENQIPWYIKVYLYVQGDDEVNLMIKWKQDVRVKAMIALTNPDPKTDFTIDNYTVTAEKEVALLIVNFKYQ